MSRLAGVLEAAEGLRRRALAHDRLALAAEAEVERERQRAKAEALRDEAARLEEGARKEAGGRDGRPGGEALVPTEVVVARRWYAHSEEGRDRAGRFTHSVCCGEDGIRADRDGDGGHACVATAYGDTRDGAALVAAEVADGHNEVVRLRAENARLRAELEAQKADRRNIVDGVREALAAGVGANTPGGTFEKAAATEEAMVAAFGRWQAVGVHGITGLALYERGDGPGGFVFKRFATQEEDDAFITCHQTNLAAMLAWREAAVAMLDAIEGRALAVGEMPTSQEIDDVLKTGGLIRIVYDDGTHHVVGTYSALGYARKHSRRASRWWAFDREHRVREWPKAKGAGRG